MLATVLFLVFLSAAVTWALLWALIPVLRRYLLDQPNSRSSHLQPTPSGGGFSFVLVASVVSLISSLSEPHSFSSYPVLFLAPLFGLPLALVGLLDDCLNLPVSLRYGVQLITSFVVVILSPLVPPALSTLPLIFLLILVVTAVINFTNFMDGIDGLVAGCMLVLITVASIKTEIPLPIWSLAGALLGFLIWNWSPSKVFMGDVGSTFLGAVFAMLVLQVSTPSEALALLLVATPLLGDASLCVLRRFIAGQRVFQAHRLHLFQRLHQAGWPHARVSSLYIAATAVLAIALLLGGLPWVITLSGLELLIGVWLDQRVAVPFSAASCD
jgi:Fuc2NAc and GlcNAc transferase